MAAVETAVTRSTHLWDVETGFRFFSYAISKAVEVPVAGISSPKSSRWTMKRFKTLVWLVEAKGT